MAKNDEVLEGFLCPICMKDLSSIAQLQAHFEEEHETEDKAVLNSLKGFFNKAKKKLLNEEDEIEGSFSRRLQNPFFNEAHTFEANNPWEWEPLCCVPSRSHNEIYKKIRNSRVDSFVAETNKLLIRLDKLLYQIPSDPGKRKAHEKDIVPWADDKDVPLCPFCARTFNLAKRRHHCRLCGAIMCNECSKLLSFTYAQKLVYPIRHGNTTNNDILHAKDDKSSSQSTFGTLLVGLSGLKRSGSHGSLNSLMSAMDSLGKEQQCFKICAHCLARLKVRDRQVEQRSSKPLLSIYYDKLMEYRKLLSELLTQYTKMVESLSVGETTYNLKDADELRMKILRLGDTISMTAQKIRNLGAAGIAMEGQETCNVDGEKIAAGLRQDLLQKRIHSSTVGFLKDNVLGLPKLPSAEDIQKRREKRRIENDARLAAQRETARQAEERAALILRKKKMSEDSPRANSTVSSSSSSSSAYSTPKRRIMEEISIDAGWLADTAAHNVIETDDPIVQQMNIIRNYIKQARDASKYDEVVLLEANLRELQLEFKSQQRLLES